MLQVSTTISRGRVAFADGQIKLKAGSGRFVKLPAFAPAVYEGLEEQGKARLEEMFPYGSIPVRREGDQAAHIPDEL